MSWIKVGETGNLHTRYIAEKLFEGKQYYFRVFAINDEGQSKPNEIKEPIYPKKEASMYYLF